MKLDRRTFLAGSVGLAAGAATTALLLNSYSESLEQILWHGLDLFHLDVRGKSVLLKPNLVDYIPGNHINTHPLLVAAAAECFRRLGAKSVIVGEGSGHQRDTELVLFESGFADQLREQKLSTFSSSLQDLFNAPK